VLTLYSIWNIGTGTVHHVAFRTPTDEKQKVLRSSIIKAGLNATPVIDRTYFHSVYFREPGGILFEIATDPPGFTTDQKPSELGTRLMLPEWLESERNNLEKILPKLSLSYPRTQSGVRKIMNNGLDFIHRFISANSKAKKSSLTYYFCTVQAVRKMTLSLWETSWRLMLQS